MAHVVVDGTFESWHAAARNLLAYGVHPTAVQWADARDPQLAIAALNEATASASSASRFSVPRSFVTDAKLAACHRDHARWPLLYRLVWRLTHGEREVLTNPLDADVRLLESMVTQVRRDEHKMHAFVRFRKVVDADGERYVAFHQPDHFIVRLAAPFFVERYRVMRWSILTPDECAHWDGETLQFTAGVDASRAPSIDALEELWRTYYAAVFNPARVNPRAMMRELPRRHWATLPEAPLIPKLVAEASDRVDRMITSPAVTSSARPFIPAGDTSLADLRDAAAGCRGCALFSTATQVVFGAGPETARLMLVGEQPGDEEDLSGQPFVGPAGKVLSEAIAAAGLDRSALYVTNAVKHFTFRCEGKRRIHERPRTTDVRACRPWLEAEIDRIKPEVIVCLGSTAAQAMFGPQIRIQRDRGRFVPSHWARLTMPTYHPSAVLRADDARHGEEIFAWLVQDLRQAGAALSASG